MTVFLGWLGNKTLLSFPYIILRETVWHQRAAQRYARHGLLSGDGHGDGGSARFPDADAAVDFLGGVVGESQG